MKHFTPDEALHLQKRLLNILGNKALYGSRTPLFLFNLGKRCETFFEELQADVR